MKVHIWPLVERPTTEIVLLLLSLYYQATLREAEFLAMLLETLGVVPYLTANKGTA
jgi:hypothetical protein